MELVAASSVIEEAGFTRLPRERSSTLRQVDFRIAPFSLRDMDMPKDGQGPNLYIPLDSKWTSTEYYKYLDEIFDSFVAFEAINKSEYLFSIPLKTRNQDAHKGSCFIKFKTTVPVETIACIRTFLYGYEGLKCFWAKPVEKSENSTTKKTKKSSLTTALLSLDLNKLDQETSPCFDKILQQFDVLKKTNKKLTLTSALKTAIKEALDNGDLSDKEAGEAFIKVVLKYANNKKSKERKEQLKKNFVVVEPVTSNEWSV